MKQLESRNLIELENLEPRILLSGDALFPSIVAGMLDQPDTMLDTDPGLSPIEEVSLSDQDGLENVFPLDNEMRFDLDMTATRTAEVRLRSETVDRDVSLPAPRQKEVLSMSRKSRLI